MRAVCCYQLNKLQEAEDALLGDGSLAAHQLHLLGLVCQRGNRLEQVKVGLSLSDPVLHQLKATPQFKHSLFLH